METAPARLVSMTNIIDDETRGVPFNAAAYPYLTAWVSGTGTINAGKISFEEADWNPQTETPYGGTWSVMANTYDVTASSLSGGKMLSVRFPVGRYSFIRPFIETAIGGGGSVSVVFTATGS